MLRHRPLLCRCLELRCIAIGLRTSIALSALLALGACQSADPAFLTPRGRHVSEVPPVPFRIAVAPLVVDAGIDLQRPGEGGLAFAFDRTELHARLIRELEAVRTASEVFAVGEPALDEAKAARADLLLRPRLTALRLAHQGTSSQHLLSSFLWLTTWLGGSFVQDSNYDARLEVEWGIVNPFDNRDIDRVLVSSETVDLSAWQRNGTLSLPMLQTLVLPPVLTSDDATGTSRSLSEIATARVAARLASYLKSSFGRETRDVVGELRLDSPSNGESLHGPLHLRGRIIAAEPVTALNVYVNDEPVRVLRSEDLPPATQQSRGSTFQLPIREELSLQPGSNVIAIEFAIRGNYSSRTIVVHGAAADAAALTAAAHDTKEIQ